MLLNLVDNALQHVPADGVIHIALEQRDAEVRITVADNGPGIPIDAQAHIFERFYRADRARSRRDAAEVRVQALGWPLRNGLRPHITADSTSCDPIPQAPFSRPSSLSPLVHQLLDTFSQRFLFGPLKVKRRTR